MDACAGAAPRNIPAPATVAAMNTDAAFTVPPSSNDGLTVTLDDLADKDD
jgi:hypothetical protein